MTPALPLALGLALAAAKPAPAGTPSPAAAEAVRLHDEGKYAEACLSLRKLDAEGALSGPLLYRLFFCERSAGNDAAAGTALERAREALESENIAGAPLDVPFYLANVYANLGRGADARRVAEAATSSLEAGKRPKPTGVIDAFQVGKLYQDQARQEEALRWYGEAIRAYDPASGRYAGSIRWALRYTGAAATARADHAGAEAALSKLTEIGDAEAADWISLAVARGRLKKYELASEAWRKAVQLAPQSADDPRYSARIASIASRIPALPTVAGEGKAFSTMSGEELEATMKAEAGAVREVQGRAAAALQAGMDAKTREGLASELAAIQGRFIAAAMEYALRRGPIRETAFREGYAVLIFQDREWEIPEAP